VDHEKRSRLIEELSQEREPQLVPIGRFFDGNDDTGSIGCNLPEHPGIHVFRDVFAQLASRQDVTAIYAQIAELDPGDDCWPFADTVFVVGSITNDELRDALVPLEPDEVGSADEFGVSDIVSGQLNGRTLVAWWD
jgi:hypothetical protein